MREQHQLLVQQSELQGRDIRTSRLQVTEEQECLRQHQQTTRLEDATLRNQLEHQEAEIHRQLRGEAAMRVEATNYQTSIESEMAVMRQRQRQEVVNLELASRNLQAECSSAVQTGERWRR